MPVVPRRPTSCWDPRPPPPKDIRRFIAQSAASDWDMVIVPQSAFTAINVSNDVHRPPPNANSTSCAPSWDATVNAARRPSCGPSRPPKRAWRN